MGGRVECVLSFFSRKTAGLLPLGLYRGSLSGGGRGEQEGTGLCIPEILKPVGTEWQRKLHTEGTEP